MSTGRGLFRRIALPASLVAAAIVALPFATSASSHREAPGITEKPKVDGTDFYMFRSYEAGRAGFVTLVANYLPLQDPYGGPNYFTLDPDALYEIHIDNDGDAREDLTFQLPLPATRARRHRAADRARQAVACRCRVINVGPIGAGDNAARSTSSRATRVDDRAAAPTASAVRERTRRPASASSTSRSTTSATSRSPTTRPTPRRAPTTSRIPGCAATGGSSSGQRKDPFVVNLGEVFDLVNVTNPLGPVDAEADDLADKNVTSLILEVPIACLTSKSTPGDRRLDHGQPARTRMLTTTRPSEPSRAAPGPGLAARHAARQRGRDRPQGQGPLQRERAEGRRAVRHLRHQPDAAGAPGDPVRRRRRQGAHALPARRPGGGVPHRRPGPEPPNGSVARDAAAQHHDRRRRRPAAQNNLGVLGGDIAGFPNGRRPGDDVVDIELRVAMGVLCHAFPGVFCHRPTRPRASLPFTDGALQDASQFDSTFPYLRTPLPGSPNGTP